MLVRASAARHGETPGALQVIKGRLGGCPAVTGVSRVTVSSTCRSLRLGESAGGGQLGESRGRFESLLQIGKLPVGAPGRGDQEYRDTVLGPLGGLGGREPVVEPLGQARVPVVVHAPPRGQPEDVWKRHGSARTAPGPCCRKMRLRAGCPRRGAGVAFDTALQVAFFVKLPPCRSTACRSPGSPYGSTARTTGRRLRGLTVSRPAHAWLRLPLVADRSSAAWRRRRAAACLREASDGCLDAQPGSLT